MGLTDNIDKVISNPKSLSSFGMGRDDVNLLCTHGKITIWFGRQVPDVVVGYVLIAISSIDASSVHEFDIVCPFENIEDYESHGYILVSYAKTDNGYRTAFNIPFSSKMALYHFAESIISQLKDQNLQIDVYWTGDDADIVLLYHKLSSINDWELKLVKYKDEDK